MLGPVGVWALACDCALCGKGLQRSRMSAVVYSEMQQLPDSSLHTSIAELGQAQLRLDERPINSKMC